MIPTRKRRCVRLRASRSWKRNFYRTTTSAPPFSFLFETRRNQQVHVRPGLKLCDDLLLEPATLIRACYDTCIERRHSQEAATPRPLPGTVSLLDVTARCPLAASLR